MVIYRSLSTANERTDHRTSFFVRPWSTRAHSFGHLGLVAGCEKREGKREKVASREVVGHGEDSYEVGVEISTGWLCGRTRGGEYMITGERGVFSSGSRRFRHEARSILSSLRGEDWGRSVDTTLVHGHPWPYNPVSSISYNHDAWIPHGSSLMNKANSAVMSPFRNALSRNFSMLLPPRSFNNGLSKCIAVWRKETRPLPDHRDEGWQGNLWTATSSSLRSSIVGVEIEFFYLYIYIYCVYIRVLRSGYYGWWNG